MSIVTLPLTTSVPTVGSPAKLRLWPGIPNTWGKNPQGKPLYRIIWSQSHTYRLGGCWPDSKVEYRWAPYYGSKAEWVLEKWLSAEEFAGTESEWIRSNVDEFLAGHGITVYTMGPYPREGWYDHCYSFPNDSPPNLELIVPLLEQTKNLTLAQIKAGIQLYHEQQKKDWERKVEDGLRDAQTAFGDSMTAGNPSKPTGDTAGLSTPQAICEAVQKYRGLKIDTTPIDPAKLPRRGVGMGIPKPQKEKN